MNRLVIRPDDQPAKQRFRIQIYKNERDALLQHFQQIAIHIDGNQPMDDVFEVFTVEIKRRGIDLRKASKL